MSLPKPFRLERYAEVDSTNDIIAARALDGEPEGLVVTATAQRKGRGRQGRGWSSPVGNLYLSLLLRPQRPSDETATLSLVVGLALAEAIGDRARLKWPNDVLVDGAKVAGILLEAHDGTIIVGIGVNVTTAPVGTPYPAGSLMAAGVEISAETLLERLLERLAVLYADWQQHGFAVLRQRWLDHADGIGAEIRFRKGSVLSTVRLLGLANDGSIAVETADGKVARHSAGELILPDGRDRA